MTYNKRINIERTRYYQGYKCLQNVLGRLKGMGNLAVARGSRLGEFIRINNLRVRTDKTATEKLLQQNIESVVLSKFKSLDQLWYRRIKELAQAINGYAVLIYQHDNQYDNSKGFKSPMLVFVADEANVAIIRKLAGNNPMVSVNANFTPHGRLRRPNEISMRDIRADVERELLLEGKAGEGLSKAEKEEIIEQFSGFPLPPGADGQE